MRICKRKKHSLLLKNVRLIVWGVFCIFGLTVAGAACKKPRPHTASESNPILTGNHPISIDISSEGSKFKITVSDLPPNTQDVFCHVNDTQEVSCRYGVEMNNLADGEYRIYVRVVTADGTINEMRDFVVNQGVWKDKASASDPQVKPVSNQDVQFKLSLIGESAKFENYAAIPKSKPLNFEFQLETNQSCTVKYMCSQGQDIWFQCDIQNRPRFDIDPREIREGFQKASIKATCDAEKLTSNVIDLFWFGVSDNYQPLMLSRRLVNKVANYYLMKQNDCTADILFECREPGETAFKSCENVRTNPPSGFQIRALCGTGSQQIVGPTFSEP